MRKRLTGRRGAANTNGSVVRYSLVVNCLANRGIGMDEARRSLSFESLSTRLVVTQQVVDTGEIETANQRQGHFRLVDYNWVRGNGQGQGESTVLFHSIRQAS